MPLSEDSSPIPQQSAPLAAFKFQDSYADNTSYLADLFKANGYGQLMYDKEGTPVNIGAEQGAAYVPKTPQHYTLEEGLALWNARDPKLADDPIMLARLNDANHYYKEGQMAPGSSLATPDAVTQYEAQQKIDSKGNWFQQAGANGTIAKLVMAAAGGAALAGAGAGAAGVGTATEAGTAAGATMVDGMTAGQVAAMSGAEAAASATATGALATDAAATMVDGMTAEQVAAMSGAEAAGGGGIFSSLSKVISPVTDWIKSNPTLSNLIGNALGGLFTASQTSDKLQNNLDVEAAKSKAQQDLETLKNDEKIAADKRTSESISGLRKPGLINTPKPLMRFDGSRVFTPNGLLNRA